MSDKKSKMPDLNEITGMAGKFFKDVKTSICEIVQDYKTKHAKKEEPTPETKEKPEKRKGK